jgi:hypothetical protein
VRAPWGTTGSLARPQAHHQGHERHDRAEQEPRALLAEHRHLGVGRGEGEHDPAEHEGEEHAAHDVDAGVRPSQPAHVERGEADRHGEDRRRDGRDPHRSDPRPATGRERDVDLAPGEVLLDRADRVDGEERDDRGQRQEHDGGDDADATPPGGRRVDRGLRTGRRRVASAQRPHRDPQQHAADAVEDEDAAPAGEGEHGGAEQRAEHAAELLDRGDEAEGHAPALDRVERRDQRHRRGHQATTADALQEAARDHAGQVERRSGHDGPEGEGDQRGGQHRHRAADVGHPADEREHRDVSQQEARHDRRRPLQLLDADVDRGHHVGQREHDDVGVDGREHDRGPAQDQQHPRPAVDRSDRRPDRRPAPGRRRAHGAVISSSTS